MKTQVEENYLKALYKLSENNTDVSVNDLSKELDIKMPTVTSMMKKFSKKKWIHYESYKPIRLADKGRKEAALIVRKHRLTEMFLVEKMGVGWDEVHDIAEQIEHIKSELFFDKMDKMLNHPKFDPHGSPIPDKDGNVISTDFVKLSDCQPKEQVTLAAVTHSSDNFLRFLDKHNLELETLINIQSKENFDGSMTVKCNQKTHVLSKMVCDKLLVRK